MAALISIIPGRADVAQLHPCPKLLKLMGKTGHERCCEHRVGVECLHHFRLRVNTNSRRRSGDGIAVVGFCEEGGFLKELASARGMENHKVIVDAASDEPKPTAFDFVDRGGPVALFEQHLAGSKFANYTPSLEERRQIILHPRIGLRRTGAQEVFLPPLSRMGHRRA